MLGIGSAVPSDFDLAQPLFLAAKLLVHLVFYGKTVTVPTRHVWRVKSVHLAGTDHYVFQDLIQGRTNMDVSICIRGPIMQNEHRPTQRQFPDLFIESHRLPVLKNFGFTLRQLSLHGKGSLWQV